MPLIRLILVLGVIAGLAAFGVSNVAPVVSLVFLGMPTPALPLALWIGGAIAAGAATTLVISTLFSLSNYWALRRSRRSPQRVPAQANAQPSARANAPSPSPTTRFGRSPATRQDAGDEAWQNWEGYETPKSASGTVSPMPKAPAANAIDDWDLELDDDWDATSRRSAPLGSPRPPLERPAARSYEKEQVPKTSSRSGTVYSQSYREPEDSRSATAPKANEPVDQSQADPSRPERSADRSNLVVDADYRVIVPPYKTPAPGQDE